MFTQESKGSCSPMMQYSVLTQLQFWNLCFFSDCCWCSRKCKVASFCRCYGDLESDDAAACYLKPQSLKGSVHVCLVMRQSWLVCSKYVPFFHTQLHPFWSSHHNHFIPAPGRGKDLGQRWMKLHGFFEITPATHTYTAHHFLMTEQYLPVEQFTNSGTFL